MYIKALVKIYKCRSRRLVYETYRIINLEKYLILIPKNPLNLGGQ